MKVTLLGTGTKARESSGLGYPLSALSNASAACLRISSGISVAKGWVEGNHLGKPFHGDVLQRPPAVARTTQ